MYVSSKLLLKSASDCWKQLKYSDDFNLTWFSSLTTKKSKKSKYFVVIRSLASLGRLFALSIPKSH